MSSRRCDNLGLSLVSAALEHVDRSPEVVVEGQSRLLSRPEFASGEHMRELDARPGRARAPACPCSIGPSSPAGYRCFWARKPTLPWVFP